MVLLFASNNQHKLKEIRNALGEDFIIKSLKDAGFIEDIPETSNTLEGNAILKAQHFYNKYRQHCFADDTGLEVNALGNRPGVYSSRYAGPECDPVKNMQKLLLELQGVADRSAHFKTIIAYIENKNIHLFDGIVEGSITVSPRGIYGFGYDPVFIPKGFNKTFAEMTLEEKNQISHRTIAVNKFITFLKMQLH